MDIAPLALSAGNYWVGFHNNGGNTSDPHWTFASAGTSFDGLSARSDDGGANWTTPYPGGNMTFRVEGELGTINNNAVPEPITATLGLMGLGVLGMATRRRVA